MNLPKCFSHAGAALAIAAFATGCSTTYDHYGRPVQTVDPGLAVAGMAAAGVLGYALANDNDRHRGHHRGHHRSHRSHYPSHHYGHGYYR